MSDPATINNNNYYFLQNLGDVDCKKTDCTELKNKIGQQNIVLSQQINKLQNDGSNLNKQKYYYQEKELYNLYLANYYLFFIFYLCFVLALIIVIYKVFFVAKTGFNGFKPYIIILILIFFYPFYIGAIENIIIFLYNYFTSVFTGNVHKTRD